MMVGNNFQRLGSTSNSHVGRDFETAAQREYRCQEDVSLQKDYSVQIGLSRKKGASILVPTIRQC